MFDISDSKQTWVGLQVSPVLECGVHTATDLNQLGEAKAIHVLTTAAAFGPATSQLPRKPKDGTQDAVQMYVALPVDFLKDFQLTFFGMIALEGKAAAVPLTVGQAGQASASLPWQVFGTGWDSLMGSECVCPAFVLPAKKIKLTKAQLQTQAGKTSSKAKQVNIYHMMNLPDPSEICEEPEIEAFAADIVGAAASKKKATKKTKVPKAKAKGKAAAKHKDANFAVTFVDEPLLVYDDSKTFKVQLPPRTNGDGGDGEVQAAAAELQLVCPCLVGNSDLATVTGAEVIYVPAQKCGDSFFIALNRGPLPAEMLKLQEKSEEAADKAAVEQHLKVVESWGKLTVFQGCPDVVASHLGGANKGSSKRAGADKCGKDVKHLFS